MKKTWHLPITILLLCAFSPAGDTPETFSYSTITTLANAKSPRRIRMIREQRAVEGIDTLQTGTLFTYANRGASKVFLAGNFTNWKQAPMRRNRQGIWFYFHPDDGTLTRYNYKYMVDGIWTIDPENPDRADDKSGAYVSAFEFTPVPGRIVTSSILPGNIVEFRIRRPSARFVSLVGSFNGWSPGNDPMKKEIGGIWILRKKLEPGEHRYAFMVDGNFVPDLYNPVSRTNLAGELCSAVLVK